MKGDSSASTTATPSDQLLIAEDALLRSELAKLASSEEQLLEASTKLSVLA